VVEFVAVKASGITENQWLSNNMPATGSTPIRSAEINKFQNALKSGSGPPFKQQHVRSVVLRTRSSSSPTGFHKSSTPLRYPHMAWRKHASGHRAESAQMGFLDAGARHRRTSVPLGAPN